MVQGVGMVADAGSFPAETDKEFETTTVLTVMKSFTAKESEKR